MIWKEANEKEGQWWGDCTNTADEEAKQETYATLMGLDKCEGWLAAPYDVQGKSVLDIGGGPVSLLLKCRNRGRSVVLDPCKWPEWVMGRYEAAGIEYVQRKAEDTDLGEIFDEVWMYNVLEHVEDPQKVIATALKHGRVVRVFEWLETIPNDMHPHTFTKDLLDEYLGTKGTLHEIEWERHAPYAYSAIVKTLPRFRFHLLGLAHVPSRKEYSACAFTQKTVKMATMLKSLGHTVFFYGTEGSSVECDEFIQVSTEADRIQAYGEYDWHSEFFKHDPKDHAHQEFNRNAIREINARKQERDFLLCPMGNYDKPIADAVGLTTVESGVGYRGVFAKYRVFESYAWMAYVYGLLQQGDGSWYDAVIPNYFDPADFPYQPERDDYYLYMGRVVRRKGIDIAVQVTRELGAKLIVAGQGNLVNPVEGLNITDSHVEHVGTVGPERRAELMGRARAVFVPTSYIEPFGGVAVEAMMTGAAILTTDWGVFAETCLHGITGFRCRTFDDFLWAARNAEEIRPEDCRAWAVENYSMDRVKLMYQEYFEKLYDLWSDGWYERHPERKNLDWLRKHYPGG